MTSISQNNLNISIGNFEEFSFDGQTFILLAENGKLSLTHYSPDIIRIRSTREEFGRDFSYSVIQDPNGEFTMKFNSEIFELKSKSLKIIINKYPVFISIYDAEGNLICQDYSEYAYSWIGSEGTCYKKVFPGDQFIGPASPKSHEYSTNNVPIESLDEFYIPFLISIHNNESYGIFINNTYKSNFNFALSCNENFYSFSVEDGEIDYYFLGNSSISKIIMDFTYLTGRIQLPPLRSLGFDQIYKSDTVSNNSLQNSDQIHNPLNATKLDFTIEINPEIVNDINNSLLNEGIKNTYLISFPSGEPYIECKKSLLYYYPDFTMPEVRRWWGIHLANQYVNDNNTFYIGGDSHSIWGGNIPNFIEFDYDGDKSTIKRVRNIYWILMAQSAFTGYSDIYKIKRPLFLTNEASAGIQRFAAVTNYSDVTENNLSLTIREAMNLGLAGIPFTGVSPLPLSNISPESIMQWLTISVFSPLCINPTNFINESNISSLDNYVQQEIKKFSALRTALIPYIYSMLFHSSKTGIPLIRNMAINYPNDSNIFKQEFQNQYFFGSEFLIFPNVANAKKINAYFPQGKWKSFYGKSDVTGPCEKIIPAFIHALPVFVKESGIIPLQSMIEPSDTLFLHFYNGNSYNSFTYYEDDGYSYEYLEGQYYKREIVNDPLSRKIVLFKPNGTLSSKYSKLMFFFHDFDTIKKIKLNASKIYFTSEDNLIRFCTDNSDSEILIEY